MRIILALSLFISSFLQAEGGQMLSELKEGVVTQTLAGRCTGLLGCAAMILLAVLLSSNRRAISWRLVGFGIALQFLFAYLVLKLQWGHDFFQVANDAIVKVISFSNEGARFVFGNLVSNDIPVDGVEGFSGIVHTGALFAFSVLPTIIFFSALTAVLYHIRVLEWLVRGMSYVMRRTMRASGAESFSAAANIFVGQTEAPLLVKPFLATMTKSEIMAIMTGGFANVSGGIMAAYVAVLMGYFPDIAGHLLAASIMSAPASLVFAKIMIPETGKPETLDSAGVIVEKQDANLLDAAARGTTDGLSLALNVGAMLIAFIALIACFNALIGAVAGYAGYPEISLQFIFSKMFAPLAWLLGVPWADAPLVGSLLGTKTVVNELVAYLQMAGDIKASSFEHGKSVIIATYALCGFANFSSIGIQVGGLSTMAPGRRADFAKLGLKAMVAGSLTSFQTAAMAGMLL
ncbi:MAG: nucleoside transporter C-terminal domain-containing protein [Myxococcaceae bacterium]